MQRISIVISGGSSKGAYQLGFFKALKKAELSYSVGAVSATSIGAINAYAFLIGKLDLAEKLWYSIDVSGIWNFRSKIKEENFLKQTFTQLIHSYDNIPCDFFITLSEMSTMTAEYFNLRGKMDNVKKELLETTISIPLLTSAPLHHNGKIYFDGGVTDNIPLTPIANTKQDILIIVHFTPEYEIPSGFANYTKVINIDMSKEPNFQKGNFNFKKEQVRKMIDNGEQYTYKIIREYFAHKRQDKYSSHNISYRYFSGAKLLSILNRLLKIGNTLRITLISKLRKTL